MRILVIKLSSLGDLFHAVPAVHILKEGLSATVDWVTTDTYAQLVSCFSDVDRVISFHRRSFFSRLGPFLADLRGEEYDMIVDFQGLLKSAMVACLARGKERIGPGFHREGSGLFYSRVAGVRDRTRHAVEQNLAVVSSLGLQVSEPVFPMDVPDRPLEGPRPRVALLPVSRWQTKNWPVPHWIELAGRLHNAGQESIYLLGGPEDRMVCDEIEGGSGVPVVNLAGRMTLVETCGFLKEVDLLIANDSGPVHMAAAVGTRCLVMFGPTDPARTGPYGKTHRVLKKSMSCAPCMSRRCRIGTHACLNDLAPQEVCTAAMDMMEDGR